MIQKTTAKGERLVVSLIVFAIACSAVHPSPEGGRPITAMSANDGRTTLAAATPRSPPPTPGRVPLSGTLDVTYSCGSCGYILNLSSCNRITENMEYKYHKVIKKGMISFFSIDESRFSMKDEHFCKPYFRSRYSWGLFRRRTKLLCGQCGSHIGNSCNDHISPGKSSNLDHFSCSKQYSVKISALQPL